MIQCAKCGKKLDNSSGGGPVAAISGSIMGDEDTDSYYFCEDCGVYTVEVYHDRFLGEGEISIRGPLSKEDGDARVRLIRECIDPWDKKCRCAAHRAYFGDSLD